jgi:hypothetical protein
MMKPKPLVVLNHFTVPIAIAVTISVSDKPRAATIGPVRLDDAVRQRRNKAGQNLNAH